MKMASCQKFLKFLGNKRIFTDFSYDKKGRILKEKDIRDE